jgi:hypothetical protein
MNTIFLIQLSVVTFSFFEADSQKMGKKKLG